MPFGLVNSAATFNRMMRKLLRGLEKTESYIDDVLLHSSDWEEHLLGLRKFFESVRSAGLTIRPSKCKVGFSNVDYLGYIVGEGEISPNPEKLFDIQNTPRPVTKKQVRSFLGMVGFYLSSGPILRLPDLSRDFILQTDASGVSIGAVLLQSYDNQYFPVAYASKKLTRSELNYSVIEKECLALIWAVKKFHVYLYGKEFILETDHQPLIYLRKPKMANSRLMKWALALQPYRFQVKAIKSTQNARADYVSRI